VTAGNLHYRKFSSFLHTTFGEKVYKVGLCGDFTCPNRDGSKSVDGCLFCNPASSKPVRYKPKTSITEQLNVGCQFLRKRYHNSLFIAYFQDYTTTYANINKLEAIYREALAWPGIVGLALCTRPDCLSCEVLDLLAELNRETFLWIELGIQSAQDKTLTKLNRCHTVEDSRQAIAALQERNIAVVGHIILGLPGESAQDMFATANLLTETGVQGAKLHNLHVVADTPLAKLYSCGEYQAMTRQHYVDLAIAFLEHLRPTTVIHRLCGDAPPRLTIAPEWAPQKNAVVQAIENELVRRNTWQGKALNFSLDDIHQPTHNDSSTTKT